jgi:hypothetical protein
MRELKVKKHGKAKRYNRSMFMTKQDKLKAKASEKKTYEQITQNMKNEHDRLQKRLEIVGDPGYSLQIRKKIMDIKEHIHQLEEEKRKLTNEKFVRERKINKVIMAGQPDAMHDIQERVKENTVLFDKIQKLNKKIDFQQKTKLEADAKLSEVKEKLAKQEDLARKHELNLEEIYSKDEEPANHISSDPAVYDRKIAVIQQALKINQQIYFKKLEELKQKLEGILTEKNDSLSLIKIRHEQTIEKRKEVNDLKLKSKLVTAEELEQQNENAEEILGEIPPATIIEEDPTILKLNDVLGKLRKNGNYRSSASVRASKVKIPTTGNAFNIRNKNGKKEFEKLQN